MTLMYTLTNDPDDEQLSALLGPDFANEWNQDRVTRWLQDQGCGHHIVDIFQEHGICGKEFFHITLAKLIEILPSSVTTYLQRRELLNKIRKLGEPTASQERTVAPTNISIDTNVHQAYASEHSSFPTSANTPTSTHLASSSTPTTPLNQTSSSQYDLKDIGSGFSHMSCSRQSVGAASGGGIGLSPSSVEIPSPLATTAAAVAAAASGTATTTTTTTTTTHYSHHRHYHSPTRLSSPKSTLSRICNTFMHTSSSNTSYARMNTENDAVASDPSTGPAPSRTSGLNKIWEKCANWRPGGSSSSSSSSCGSHQKGHRRGTSTLSASSSSSGAFPEINHNLVPNKMPMVAHKRLSDTRIQVTGDRETWYSVVVTDIRDAHTLKDRILQRMNIPQQHLDRYYYYHENGPDPDAALTPQDLLAICSIADHAANQRILVCTTPPAAIKFEHPNNTRYPPVMHHVSSFNNVDPASQHLHPTALYSNTTYSLSTPELGHSPSDTPSTPQGIIAHHHHHGSGSPILPDYSDPACKQFLFANASTAALPTYHHHHHHHHHHHAHHQHHHSHDYLEPTGVQLSDPPAIPTLQLDEHAPPPAALQYRRASDHQVITTPVVEHSVSYSHRPGSGHDISSAQSPQQQQHPKEGSTCRSNKLLTRRSEPMLNRRHLLSQHPPSAVAASAAAAAAPPPPPQRSAATHPGYSRNKIIAPKAQAQLWAVPPTKRAPQPSSSPGFHQNDVNDREEIRCTAFWGERPPVEVVCQNMDQYFDNHDLDKEIVVEEEGASTGTPVEQQQQQAPRRQQQPPALRRLTHTKSIRAVAREASTKYNTARKIREGSVLRRKSTKLWGQRLVEVKPARQRKDLHHGMSPVKDTSSRNNITAGSDGGESINQPVQWIRGKLIGKGSFGRVYLALNMATKELMAVKQVEVPRTKSDRQDKRQLDMVDALYQEMCLLRDLDHDNIVQYLGYGRDNDVVNIFLEYVAGGSIASRLALHGAFEEPLVRFFTRQIVAGLSYLHGKNILHRDIKAANILFADDGLCRISDFGLSKKNDYDEVYDENSRMSLRGSIYWMAPEMVKNEPYSAKVDIWSLGCTVIEMFTGQRPWLTLNQIATLYNLGCQKAPTIPENISDIGKDFLTQCFIIDPNKRPTAASLSTHPFCRPDPAFEFTDYINNGKV